MTCHSQHSSGLSFPNSSFALGVINTVFVLQIAMLCRYHCLVTPHFFQHPCSALRRAQLHFDRFKPFSKCLTVAINAHPFVRIWREFVVQREANSIVFPDVVNLSHLTSYIKRSSFRSDPETSIRSFFPAHLRVSFHFILVFNELIGRQAELYFPNVTLN